ncbi:hypothetical protein Tco_0215307 [Tanacetum coccineum]
MHEEIFKITSWVEIVHKFFYKYYLISRASRTNDPDVKECHLKFNNWLKSKFKNPWKLSSATKNALWNFWEKGYDDNTLNYDKESSDDECSNGDNHPFFDHPQNDNDKGDKNDERSDHTNGPENFVQTDTPQSNNDKPNEGMCRMDKFEVIKYSVGDNEEFLGARVLEHNSWAKNFNGISSIYLNIFYKKDEGWTVTRTK